MGGDGHNSKHGTPNVANATGDAPVYRANPADGSTDGDPGGHPSCSDDAPLATSDARANSSTKRANATAPSPAVTPGYDREAAANDPRACVERLLARFPGDHRTPGGIDPRIPELVPGFDAPFFQAGLCGYSDAAMRLVARDHGCPFCVTEALLDRTLLMGGRGFTKADLGELDDNVPGGAGDRPLAGQIMGSDPVEMAAAAVKMVEQGARHDRAYRDMVSERDDTPSVERAGGPSVGFGAIDVNLACPVKKIAKKARGGHWLAQPAGAIEILEAVRGALPASIPVTVKMRRSFDDTPEMVEAFETIFDAAYAIGCAWVTVHGRTVEQRYVGPSRWDPLRDLARRHPERLIFGSGDVWTAGDVFRMIDYAGMHAVSVARGCIGNPWIFRQCRDLLAGREPRPPTLEEQRSVLSRHFELALAVNRRLRHPELHTAKTMRKFGIQFSVHHPDPDAVKSMFVRVKTLDDWRAVLDEHYAAPHGDGMTIHTAARDEPAGDQAVSTSTNGAQV